MTQDIPSEGGGHRFESRWVRHFTIPEQNWDPVAAPDPSPRYRDGV